MNLNAYIMSILPKTLGASKSPSTSRTLMLMYSNRNRGDQRSIGAENISIAYRLPPHTFFQFALDSEVKIRYKNIETTDGVQIWRIKVTLH